MLAISLLVKPSHQEVISLLTRNGELKTALVKVEAVTPAKWRDIEGKLGCGLQGPSRTGARTREVLKLLWNFFKIPIWQGEDLRSPTSAPEQGLLTSTRPWPFEIRPWIVHLHAQLHLHEWPKDICLPLTRTPPLVMVMANLSPGWATKPESLGEAPPASCYFSP